ncbi:MAG TPA: PilN domain-containing protein [Candidatus Xenobia bacterium]|nr:PilN domain-containing protein [Candidatus Xenobia bacterium]
MSRQLNLATRPYVNLRPFWVTFTALAVLAVGLTTGSVYEALTIWRRGTAAQARLHDLEKRAEELAAEQKALEQELRVPATLAVLERAQFLNHLIGQKRLSWTQLFFDLQQALPPEARVLSLSPRMRDDGRLQVGIQLGAANNGAVVEFLEALGQSEKFSEVKLDSQSSEGGEREDNVTAQVSAVYRQEGAK